MGGREQPCAYWIADKAKGAALLPHLPFDTKPQSKSLFPVCFCLKPHPCLCGFYMDIRKECHCTPNQIQRYMSKISGPCL